MRQTVPKEQKNARVRITDQFHGKQGMVYELSCDGVMLSLSMVGDEQRAEWAAEATAKVLPAPVIATGVGRSRGEAFSVLREVWCSQREGVPFPRFDWEAIQLALKTVRAI
jgi:hypothetical protein